MVFRTRTNKAIGIVLLLVTLITLSFSWHASVKASNQQDDLKAYVTCQAEWTSFFYLAISTNREANSEAQRALDELVLSVSGAKSRDETVKALENYKIAREQQVKAQADHPLPPPPKEVCKSGDV